MYRLITANRNYSSWSLRPWVLMTTRGIPFEDQRVEFGGMSNYDAFRSFSPSGTVPALVDGERTIWDSLAIILYLADRHSAVWPDEAAARTWAQCVVCEMHGGFPALRTKCSMSVGVRARLHGESAELRRDVDRIAEIFEEGLDRFGGPYLAGQDFSAADAFYAPVVFRIRTYDLPTGPKGAAWVERMLALPAMQEWERQSLAEGYREPGHEKELAASATILADYRAPATA